MIPHVKLRGSYVTDHRGNRLPLERPVNKLDVRDEIPGEQGRRIYAAVMRGYFGSRWWRAAVLMATVFTIAVIFLAMSPQVTRVIGAQNMAGWMGWIMPAVFGGLIGLTVWGDFALERLYARRRLTNALLNESHCPRCLYSLNGLPEDDDGCTVCPECGAAWKV